MATPETVLLVIGAVIVLGFLGQLFFRATRISDILLLVGFGVLLGDVLRPFETRAFGDLAPIVGLFALLVILFEGGLDLRIQDLLHGLGRALALSVLSFLLTATAIAAAAVWILDTSWLVGLLLGCILGGSSSIAVMPIMKRLPVTERSRVILSLESALTDVFCVVGALTIAAILALKEQPDVESISRTVANGFIIAILFGAVAGLGWLKLLATRLAAGFSYMLTLAVLLLLDVATESVGGNGPVSVLVFGIILGNHRSFARILQLEVDAFTAELRAFQSEIAFGTRAFFFVYLGLTLDLSQLQGASWAVGILLLAAIAAARAGAVFLASVAAPEIRPDRQVWWAMMPRGLAAAVLASVPSLTFGLPGTEGFVAYAAIVIVLTNLVASFAGFLLPKVHDPPATGAAS